MTYLSNAILEHGTAVVTEPFMALVDENGQEIPFTEYDIQYSLKQFSEESEDSPKALDSLMERVLAARAIA